MNYLTELLASHHDRKAFSCGNKMLDDYFHYQAGQDIKRKLAVCFVCTDQESGLVLGYYTLANNSIPQYWIPEDFKKKLPRSYENIPATLMGRLAVDTRFQGKGNGRMLLIDAFKRSYEVSKQAGSFAIVVDPVDEDAFRFYKKYGFLILPDSGKMFLPMKTVKILFDSTES